MSLGRDSSEAMKDISGRNRLFSPSKENELARIAYLLTNASNGNIDLDPFDAVVLDASQLGKLALMVQDRVLATLNVARAGPATQPALVDPYTGVPLPTVAKGVVASAGYPDAQLLASMGVSAADLGASAAAVGPGAGSKPFDALLRENQELKLELESSIAARDKLKSQRDIRKQEVERLRGRVDRLHRERASLQEELTGEKKTSKSRRSADRRVHERALRAYMKASVNALKAIKKESN